MDPIFMLPMGHSDLLPTVLIYLLTGVRNIDYFFALDLAVPLNCLLLNVFSSIGALWIIIISL